MIKSMTGYGSGESKGDLGTIKIEIKTLNNKFFDVSSKLPPGLLVFEDKMRECIQKKVKRGRVYLMVDYEGAAKKAKRVTLDKKIASSLLNEIRKFQKAEKLKGEISLNNILSFPGVLGYSEFAGDVHRLWKNAEKALDKALGNLDKSRLTEGRGLSRDLFLRVKKIEKHLRSVNKRSNTSIKHYKREFSKRIKELSGGIEIDKDRLAQEVAIYAKNCDITEEITRIKSHADNFKKSLRSGGEKGKILDFVAQELMREANTIGSKSSNFQISNHVIGIKSEIEKIREQAKNIE